MYTDIHVYLKILYIDIDSVSPSSIFRLPGWSKFPCFHIPAWLDHIGCFPMGVSSLIDGSMGPPIAMAEKKTMGVSLKGFLQGPPTVGPPFPYHSHNNPWKYGNGMGSLWEGGPTIGGPWRNPLFHCFFSPRNKWRYNNPYNFTDMGPIILYLFRGEQKPQ